MVKVNKFKMQERINRKLFSF